MKNINTNLLSKYFKTISAITTLSILINGCALIPTEKELVKPNTILNYKGHL
jgi:hypothetical protein